MSTTVEQLARLAWWAWGDFARFTFCSECGEQAYCLARRQRGPFLCIDCHDLKGG